MIDHLVGDAVHVRATLGRPDAVHEGHAELLVHRTVSNRNMPPLIRRLVDHRITAERLRILGQILALDRRTVPADLDLLTQRHCQIPDTTLNEANHICRNLRHTEPRKVRKPPDRDERLVLARLHHRLLNLRHVLLEHLRVGKAACLVHDLHRHLPRKDVHQLHAVAVLATHQLLLVLIVVCTGQELTKDHLGDPGLVLWVLRHINRLAIVHDVERLCIALDRNGLDRIRRLTAA